jgi:hypothetical protein
MRRCTGTYIVFLVDGNFCPNQHFADRDIPRLASIMKQAGSVLQTADPRNGNRVPCGLTQHSDCQKIVVSSRPRSYAASSLHRPATDVSKNAPRSAQVVGYPCNRSLCRPTKAADIWRTVRQVIHKETPAFGCCPDS